MNKPHKHAEVIKAFADGVEIQYKYGNNWIDWKDRHSPGFFQDTEYRVKPKKVQKKRWFRTYRKGDEIKIKTLDTSLNTDGLVSIPPDEKQWLSDWKFAFRVEVEE
jgi:hypothetical protein